MGSHRLRVRTGNPDAGLSFGRGVSGGVGGGGGGDQPATEEAKKPWGCTALEGLYLNGQGEVRRGHGWRRVEVAAATASAAAAAAAGAAAWQWQWQ